MNNGVRDHLNRIEGKIDGLTKLLIDFLSDGSPQRNVPLPKPHKPKKEVDIAAQEALLKARLDKLIIGRS